MTPARVTGVSTTEAQLSVEQCSAGRLRVAELTTERLAERSFRIVTHALGDLRDAVFGLAQQNLCSIHTRRSTRKIATNLTAPMKPISRLLPVLRARPSAAIVNVTSALVYAPVAAIPLYCATKATLHSYSKSLRHQLKGTELRVFELLPSTVATDMSKHRFNSKMLSPEAVVSALLRGMERDRYEIRVGQALPLYVMTRLAPSLIEPILLATRGEPSRRALPAKV